MTARLYRSPFPFHKLTIIVKILFNNTTRRRSAGGPVGRVDAPSGEACELATQLSGSGGGAAKAQPRRAASRPGPQPGRSMGPRYITTLCALPGARGQRRPRPAEQARPRPLRWLRWLRYSPATHLSPLRHYLPGEARLGKTRPAQPTAVLSSPLPFSASLQGLQALPPGCGRPRAPGECYAGYAPPTGPGWAGLGASSSSSRCPLRAVSATCRQAQAAATANGPPLRGCSRLRGAARMGRVGPRPNGGTEVGAEVLAWSPSSEAAVLTGRVAGGSSMG